jgi:hypothetical protein
LGIEFPGETYAEPGKPNWVGHLVTKYAGHHEMVAYCYAVGGAGVDDVEHQVKNYFERDIGQKPEWARWDVTDTLFGKQDSLKISALAFLTPVYDCSNLGRNQ